MSLGDNMSKERVIEYFKKHNMEEKIYEFDDSSATVALAAQQLNCEESRIAKTLAFMVEEKPILIVAAGDVKIDNAKYKEEFKVKAAMVQREDLEKLVGHAVGGVCPFEIKDGVKVYLDKSLQRFDIVYPACGASNNAIKLTIKELEEHSRSIKWIDVCKIK